MNVSSSKQYQCQVTIHHSAESGEVHYDGPEIEIETIVLTSIKNEIQDVSTDGESVTFACEFTRGDTNITIYWTVAGKQYDCIPISSEDERDLRRRNTGCYTNDSTSYLVIGDPSTFGAGDHLVECVIQESIPPQFKNDQSFKESFNKITGCGVLTVKSDVSRGPMVVEDVSDKMAGSARLWIWISIGIGITFTVLSSLYLVLFIVWCMR
jgi:hypothetical protein